MQNTACNKSWYSTWYDKWQTSFSFLLALFYIFELVYLNRISTLLSHHLHHIYSKPVLNLVTVSACFLKKLANTWDIGFSCRYLTHNYWVSHRDSLAINYHVVYGSRETLRKYLWHGYFLNARRLAIVPSLCGKIIKKSHFIIIDN